MCSHSKFSFPIDLDPPMIIPDAARPQSYHSTWSATEYDRTPLDPPSDGERTCILPERNARCLRTTVECFSSILDDTFCSSSIEETSSYSLELETTQVEADEEHREHDEEDKEWEECMERRRMMFAQMCPERDPHPEFDGYRSISATLVDILRSVGCGEGEGSSTPVPEHACEQLPVAVFSRLRESHLAEDDAPSLVSSTGSDEECRPDSPSRGASLDGPIIRFGEAEMKEDEVILRKVGRMLEEEMRVVEL